MAREGLKVKVISETKVRGDAVKRMVVETWDVCQGIKASRTYHEKLTRAGSWSRFKPKAKEAKSKPKHKKGKK